MKRTASVIFFLTCWTAFSGELMDYYFKHATNRLDLTKIGPVPLATNHGITEIGIERTVCIGGCPAYTFIAKSDGNFRYQGENALNALANTLGRFQSRNFTSSRNSSWILATWNWKIPTVE